MTTLRFIPVLFCLGLCVACQPELHRSRDIGNDAHLLETKMPPLNSDGKSLVVILAESNTSPEKPLSPTPVPAAHLIVERHGNPDYDRGDTKVDLEFPEKLLGERLRHLAEAAMTHCAISENGHVIFKTWHHPDMDEEATGDSLSSRKEP